MLLWLFLAALAPIVFLQMRLPSSIGPKIAYSLGTAVAGAATMIWGFNEISRGGSDPYFPMLAVTIAAYVLYWWRRSRYME